jgi:lipoprotein signal peptidase
MRELAGPPARSGALRWLWLSVAVIVLDQLTKHAIVAAFRPEDCFVTLATGVLGTHVGPGAWAVFYQVEDDEAAA